MSDLTNKASQSVIVLHQLIEAVFHGDGSKVSELMTHFVDDFLMVTPTGKSLVLADVEDLFGRLTGARQGMTITIEQCRVISQRADEVVIQYHELQQQQNNHSHRISLAVINCATQPPSWRYLQETMVTN